MYQRRKGTNVFCLQPCRDIKALKYSCASSRLGGDSAWNRAGFLLPCDSKSFCKNLALFTYPTDRLLSTNHGRKCDAPPHPFGNTIPSQFPPVARNIFTQSPSSLIQIANPPRMSIEIALYQSYIRYIVFSAAMQYPQASLLHHIKSQTPAKTI